MSTYSSDESDILNPFRDMGPNIGSIGIIPTTTTFSKFWVNALIVFRGRAAIGD